MYKQFHTFVFVSLSLFLFTGTAEAWVPDFVDFETPNHVFLVEDATLVQAFHGELNNFPQTYEFMTNETIMLSVEILVPDIESSQNIISAIIIKKPEVGGRVSEITRMAADKATWETQFERLSGDSYRKGPAFEQEIESGTYRIEVHTPDNIGKYVLLVGTNDDIDIGYFEIIGRLIETKRFFEKTPLLIVQSPYVYIPAIVILIFVGFILYRRTMRNEVLEQSTEE